ncbi:MAG TPA: class I SAM-dependent methyltransferase [Aggregatilineales bacterium]|nr:class I SAM-dependent methyltransferase [Anaerolineales bacterium]HRE46701.1 class I SAM-dependent methyltransferase [Aggregatilineales bacterium]
MTPESTPCLVCQSPNTAALRPYRTTKAADVDYFGALTLVQCAACGVSFAHPMPTQATLDTYYTTAYRSHESDRRLEDTNNPWDGMMARARAQLDFIEHYSAGEDRRTRPFERCLDVGAGYGFFLDEVQRRGTVATTAVELDTHSRARLTAQGHTILDHLREAQGEWSLIAFSHLLEHMPNPHHFLAQVRALLSPTGYIFCEVPNDTHIAAALDDAPHLVFYTQESLVRLFERGGFAIVKVSLCGVSDTRLQNLTRRVQARLLAQPPRFLERWNFQHFRYSHKGKWIRLLAKRV